MKPTFPIFTGFFTRAALVAGLLGVFSLTLNPETNACGPVIKMTCPVVGLGSDVQPGFGCPGGYCPRTVSLKSPSLDYKGGKIYFCCPMCIQKFKKETAKFAANANLQLASTFQAAQTACPLCSGKTSPAFTCMIGGLPVSFCSEECKKKVAQAKPAEQLQMVFADAAFGKGFIIKTQTPSPKAPAPAPKTQGASTTTSATASCGCCCQTQAAQQVRVKRD